MKKISLFVVLILIFCVASLVTGFAYSDRELPLLVDNADLLTNSEEKTLNSKLERISEEQECDIAIVTVLLDGKTANEYADDFLTTMVMGTVIMTMVFCCL